MARSIGICITFALLVVGVAQAQSGQQFYRWTDASGATHYSDTPPPGGKATRVAVDGRVPTPAPPTPKTAAAAGSTDSLDKAEASARTRNCQNAQNNLATLQGNAMVVDSSDLTKARRMSEEERAGARKTAEADVTTYCGGAKP